MTTCPPYTIQTPIPIIQPADFFQPILCQSGSPTSSDLDNMLLYENAIRILSTELRAAYNAYSDYYNFNLAVVNLGKYGDVGGYIIPQQVQSLFDTAYNDIYVNGADLTSVLDNLNNSALTGDNPLILSSYNVYGVYTSPSCVTTVVGNFDIVFSIQEDYSPMPMDQFLISTYIPIVATCCNIQDDTFTHVFRVQTSQSCV